MRKFILFSLMLMAASMFLFLGGCQREEVIQDAKISKSIHTKGYNPVFDTIPKILNGRNALDSLPFQAPTTLQLRQLSENLKTIKSNHNVAQKAVSLKKSGSILSSNYAIITKEISTEDVYYITIPFIKDKVVTAILFYVKYGDNQFLANIYTKVDIETNMLSTAVPSNDFYLYYNLVNSLSNYQWIIENKVDKVKVDWLKENARIASRRPSGRCIEYVINVPTVVSMVYSPTNPNSPAPYYTWGTTTMVVPCAQEHNGYIGPGAVWPTDGSGSNNPNIQSGSDSVLVEKLLALDEDCLRLLQNDMKNELLNSVSPCNQELLNSQITQAFNKACAEAKQNGGDNFLQNIEMWEFTESVREALGKLLGLGSTLDQNVPPLSSSNKLCPNSIIVTASEWEPNRQNVAGISNLQISLNNGVNLSFQNLFFKIDHTRDCGISTEQLIADAINNAMQIANENIRNGNPIFDNGLNNNIQFTRLVEEQMKSIASNAGCKPKANPDNNQTTNVPPFAAQAIPSSYGNATIGSEHCGAKFVQFSAMQAGCP